MRSIIVFFIVAAFLGATLASTKHHKIENVHSEVMSYVKNQMASHPMMRTRSSPAHLECYDGFIPLINSLAANARYVSKYCVSDANELKDQNMSELEKERKTIQIEADKVLKSLADCSQKNGILYFECLVENTERNSEIMKIIGEKSKELMSKYSEKLAEIDRNEDDCLINAIDMAKIASDKAFGDLKSCINGGPAIQPLTDEMLL